MWRFIHRRNIELLRKRVAEEKNEEERLRLARQLAEEEARHWRTAEKHEPEPRPLR